VAGAGTARFCCEKFQRDCFGLMLVRSEEEQRGNGASDQRG